MRTKIIRLLNKASRDPESGIGLGDALAYGKEVDGTPYLTTILRWYTPKWYTNGVAPIICRVFGHKWVDTSYGGPNTGWDSGHCTRCGFSFHHTYY